MRDATADRAALFLLAGLAVLSSGAWLGLVALYTAAVSGTPRVPLLSLLAVAVAMSALRSAWRNQAAACATAAFLTLGTDVLSASDLVVLPI